MIIKTHKPESRISKKRKVRHQKLLFSPREIQFSKWFIQVRDKQIRSKLLHISRKCILLRGDQGVVYNFRMLFFQHLLPLLQLLKQFPLSTTANSCILLIFQSHCGSSLIKKHPKARKSVLLVNQQPLF